MKKQIACSDVVPGCQFRAEAATEEELLQKVAEHARAQHGVTEVGPDLLATVKEAIKTRE